MSDTTARGILQPSAGATLEDDAALDAILQSWLRSLTGLPGEYVRPRWQPNPPPMPDQTTDWCAVGVTMQEPDASDWIGHHDTGDGSDPLTGTSTMQRHESVEATATFYGPRASAFAGLLRDNCQIGQNRDTLTDRDIVLVGVSLIRVAPEVVGQLWIRRADVTITLRRQLTRTYAIRTLVAAPVQIANDPT